METDNIKKALELKSQLDALRPIPKEDELRIMQKLRLDWNFHSNHIEGNSLTYGETKALILFGITAQSKPLKDHFEITGHNEAVNWVVEIVKQDRPLTESFIRQLHKLILKEPYEVDAITPEGQPTKKRIKIGDYKSIPNHVKTSTGEIFRFASPEETPAMMNDLMQWYKSKMDQPETNPIILAAEFHYKFIRIHPFDDGNGRTARILMNFILMQFGYPPAVIRTEDKQNYFGVLRQADSGQITPFIDYIAQNLVASLDIMIRGAKGENIREPDDLDKEIKLLEQQLKTKGSKIEVVKNEEILKEIYQKSISPLLTNFIKYSRKFDQFYLNASLSFLAPDGRKLFWKTSEELDKQGQKISISLLPHESSFTMEYRYQTFNNSAVKPFDYRYQIEALFEETRYLLRNGKSEVLIEKLYNEQLSEAEIEAILQKEAYKHKEFIQKKIQ
ncbi:MAG: Fic family protein [Bacteroidota bacterium]